jgi:hypothetical protein
MPQCVSPWTRQPMATWRLNIGAPRLPTNTLEAYDVDSAEWLEAVP